MKYRHTAQIPTCPFGLVLIHPWVDGGKEGTEEGSFPCRSNDTTLVPYIFNCVFASVHHDLDLAEQHQFLLLAHHTLTLIVRNENQ